MKIFESDPVSQLAFAVHENRGVFALLLGSGVSRSSGIPTGWEITLDLVRRLGALEGVEHHPDWETWYVERYCKAPDYSEMVDLVAKTPTERRSVLNSYIEPTEVEQEDGLKQATAAHQAIAKLVKSGHIKVIVTTNFDRLLENAIRDEGIEPTVVSSPDDLSGAEPLTHSRCYIFKLHGDYKDARILNTEAELAKYPKKFNVMLDRIFDEYGIIVSGWSGNWDDALIAALKRAPNRRYSTYWTVLNASNSEPSELMRHRKAHVVDISSADDFFADLQARVLTLDSNRFANPTTLAMLLNSVKRLMVKPEYRIELNDLIDDQLGQLLNALNLEDFPNSGSWSDEEFARRVDSYEQLSEPMARVAGILGRFGKEAEYTLIADVIKSVAIHTRETGGGLTVWLNIRSYPAVLIAYSYGIGLVRSRSYDALFKLFQEHIPNRNERAAKPLVNSLFLRDWEGRDSDYWKRYSEAYSRKKTPLSDRLCEITAQWETDLVGRVPEYELLFEEFETLASLAHFSGNSRSEIDKAFSQNSAESIEYFRVPFGRVIWHSQTRRRLVEKLQEPQHRDRLLAAGFAQGEAAVLTHFLTKFEHFSERMSW